MTAVPGGAAAVARRPPLSARPLVRPYAAVPRLAGWFGRPTRDTTLGGIVVMATVAALPPTLRAKIDAVARHVRLLRTVRGLSALVLLLALTAGLALLADAAFDLPWAVRAAL